MASRAVLHTHGLSVLAVGVEMGRDEASQLWFSMAIQF